MNFARVAVAAVLAWLASIGVGYLVDEVLLADLYLRHAAVMRDADDAGTRLPWAISATFVGFFIFSYVYAKGYEQGSGLQQGLRFGVIVALLLLCFAVTWRYVLFPVAGTLLAAWAVTFIIEFALYGMIVGAVYRPLPPAVKR